MKTTQLAAILMVSTMTARRMAGNGTIPGAQKTKGGHYRFPPSPEFEHWLKAEKRQMRIAQRALRQLKIEQMTLFGNLSKDCEEQADTYVSAQAPAQVARRQRARNAVGGSERWSNEKLFPDASEAVGHALHVFAVGAKLMKDSFERANYFEPCSNWPPHMLRVFSRFLGPLEWIACEIRAVPVDNKRAAIIKKQMTRLEREIRTGIYAGTAIGRHATTRLLGESFRRS